MGIIPNEYRILKNKAQVCYELTDKYFIGGDDAASNGVKNMTDAQKYREMIRLYQLSYCEKEALELARELMTSNLPASKMKDVEHIYYACGGK